MNHAELMAIRDRNSTMTPDRAVEDRAALVPELIRLWRTNENLYSEIQAVRRYAAELEDLPALCGDESDHVAARLRKIVGPR